MDNSAQRFHIPQTLSLPEQVNYCLVIIHKLREELTPIRKQVTYCQKYHDTFSDTLQHWKEKYQQEQQKNDELQKEVEKLKQEKEQLQLEIEKMTKTENRLQQSVFAHGNFHHPTQGGKKPNGGQKGHADTNQDKNRNLTAFRRQRIYASECGNCGNRVNRVESVKEKTLIDIQINTQIIQVVLESERQWCPVCRQAVTARSLQALPFTEYGINTFMMIMLMRFRGNLSLCKISDNLFYGFGLRLSGSVILSMLKQAERYLHGKYKELKQAVRDGEVMYNDETGWLIKGDKAYMWIMASADTKDNEGNIIPGITVYVAAETKGKGVFKEMYGKSKAKSMHDGNSSYEGVTGAENSMYCWTHVVRFAFDETVKLPQEHLACQIRDRLVALYVDIRQYPTRTKTEKEAIMRTELDKLLAIESDDESVKNILHRIRTQKEGLILALLVTEDGTNNLAEREFRQLVISRYISFGSASFTGMQITAVLSSILQTLHRDKKKPFLTTLKSYLTDGIQEKYPQYKHTASFVT